MLGKTLSDRPVYSKDAARAKILVRIKLVGARRRDRLSESLGATSLVLSGQDLADIEAAVPANAAAGTRYDAGQMAMLDSERR